MMTIITMMSIYYDKQKTDDADDEDDMIMLTMTMMKI